MLRILLQALDGTTSSDKTTRWLPRVGEVAATAAKRVSAASDAPPHGGGAGRRHAVEESLRYRLWPQRPRLVLAEGPKKEAVVSNGSLYSCLQTKSHQRKLVAAWFYLLSDYLGEIVKSAIARRLTSILTAQRWSKPVANLAGSTSWR